MLHSRTLNNKVNHIHERALKIIYSDYKSYFNEPLDKDSPFTIHQKMSKVQQLKLVNTYMTYDLLLVMLGEVFKGPRLGLRQFLIIESLLKMMKKFSRMKRTFNMK